MNELRTLHRWGVYRYRRTEPGNPFRGRPPRRVFELVSHHKTQDVAARHAGDLDLIARTAHYGWGIIAR